MANFAVIVSVLVIALFVNEGESLRCWSCSSEVDPSCNDPFLANRGHSPNSYFLTDCDRDRASSYPFLYSSKPVCSKKKIYIDGRLSVRRGCTWKKLDDYSNICPDNAHAQYSYCETCEYDGCNSATSIGKTIALLVAPLGLLLFK